MRVVLCYNKKPKSDYPSPIKSECLGHFFDISYEKYAELDDEQTIKAIAKAIGKFHEIYLVEADEYAYNELSDIRPEIVFNIAEGLKGPYRESYIPSILEFLQIPYTGSDPLTLSVCLNKHITKKILIYHKIQTPEFQLISSIEKIASIVKTWKHYPCIVKPVHEGSSIGVRNNSIVDAPHELLDLLKWIVSVYKQPAIIERLLIGREFTVGVLGNGKNAEILPPIEISFNNLPKFAKPIYSYEAKWIWDEPKNPLDIFKCPAEIDGDLFKRIRKIVLSTYKFLGCLDWARIDLRLDENNKPEILEVNPLPGILPKPEDNSCMPKAARIAGLEYEDLILTVLDIACKRYGIITEHNGMQLIKRQIM
jgi:D-alanine-D-alanine ligase